MTSLVFPTYNPGPAIDRTVAATREFLRTRPDRWEVLFVCDGCTDGTADRIRHLIRGDRRFRVITYTPNRGKGYAVRTGLLAARGRWRIFTDVDLAYRFSDIVRVAEAMRAGAAIAIASREHPESRVELPPCCLGYALRRRLQSLAFRIAVQMLLPVRHDDTQAGLKGVTAELADGLVPLLQCDGFGFDCELLTACARHGVPVAEVPVTVRHDGPASTTGGWRTVTRMLLELWEVRRRWPEIGFPPLRPAVPTAAPEPVLVEAA